MKRLIEYQSMRIILVGNPNVGKSVVFSYLTGYSAVSSNYPGTTVEILKGKAKLGEFDCEVVDLPGCYSLTGESAAEKVASDIIKSCNYDVIFNIVDSCNIERNLFLTLDLLRIKKPLVIITTKNDIAKSRGIEIDYSKLSGMLGVKVFPVVATAGIGFDLLEKGLSDILCEKTLPSPAIDIPDDSIERWKIIGEVFLKTVRIIHKHPTFLEKLELITTTPSTAIPFAFVVGLACFYIVRFIGEGIINWIMDPLFNRYYMPVVERIANNINGVLKDLLFSKNIMPLEGFSVLTTGVYIPFVVVLPYIFSFYLVLGMLEDIGYLPRLAVVLDRLSHKIGLHGYGSIPLIMGLGCKIPGIFSSRILESKKEKLIAASLMFLISPCIPQTAMIVSVLSRYPWVFTFFFFAYVFFVGVIASYLLNRIIGGVSNDLFIEIPPYHKPTVKN
ncbi:MAG: FeoB small GTPase domain-containing protein, partial [Elusimicrobiales bacterium]